MGEWFLSHERKIYLCSYKSTIKSCNSLLEICLDEWMEFEMFWNPYRPCSNDRYRERKKKRKKKEERNNSHSFAWKSDRPRSTTSPIGLDFAPTFNHPTISKLSNSRPSVCTDLKMVIARSNVAKEGASFFQRYNRNQCLSMLPRRPWFVDFQLPCWD